MTLHAPEAAELLIAAAEAGGSALVAIVVGGSEAEAFGRRLALVLGVSGVRSTHGSLGNAVLDTAALTAMETVLDDPRGGDGLHTVEAGARSIELYLEVRRPVRDLIVVGAGHIAQPLSRVGAMLGFRVTVLDDRPDFATRERFPEAERIVRADFSDPFVDVRIHARSYVLLVTRGHKYDYECLIRLLRMDPAPAYVGMIGSRRRVRATYVQLVEDGIDRDKIDRIYAPVGLDVGAETPEEIAVAVAAELVLIHRGGSGAPLRDVERIAERFFAAPATDAP